MAKTPHCRVLAQPISTFMHMVEPEPDVPHDTGRWQTTKVHQVGAIQFDF